MNKTIRTEYNREFTIFTEGTRIVFGVKRVGFGQDIRSYVPRENAEQLLDAFTEALESTKPKPTKAERVRALVDKQERNIRAEGWDFGADERLAIRAILDEDGPL